MTPERLKEIDRIRQEHSFGYGIEDGSPGTAAEDVAQLFAYIEELESDRAPNTAILDAAVEVAAFSRTHGWPKEQSPEFFEFAQKLDQLSTALGKKYPHFNKRIETKSGTQWICTHCGKTFSDSYYCLHCGSQEDFELAPAARQSQQKPEGK